MRKRPVTCRFKSQTAAGGTALAVLGIALAVAAALTVALQVKGLSLGTMGYLSARDTSRVLNVAKAYVIAWSADPDADHRNEPLAAAAGNKLPAVLPVSAMDGQVLYCPKEQGSTNNADARYASLNPVVADDAPVAVLFMPGIRKNLMSTCSSTTAEGDDATKTVMRAEIEATPRAVGGLVDEGQTIRPVVPGNNVDFSQSLVTIFAGNGLPATDPAGAAILTGTIAYDSGSSEFAVYNGASWNRYKLP